jgi:hypothetical protein
MKGGKILKLFLPLPTPQHSTAQPRPGPAQPTPHRAGRKLLFGSLPWLLGLNIGYRIGDYFPHHSSNSSCKKKGNMVAYIGSPTKREPYLN